MINNKEKNNNCFSWYEEQFKINILNQFKIQKTRDPDFLSPDPDPAFQVIPYLGYVSKLQI